MAWTQARDQIVSIIEGTTPSTTVRGLPATFEHFEEAGPDAVPDSRAFFVEIKRMQMKGQVSNALPRWLRYEADVVMVYRDDVDRTALMEAIAADHLAICTRLPDASLWGQPTSTIESLYLGRDLIGDAEIEQIEGAVLVTYPMTIEFRAS